MGSNEEIIGADNLPRLAQMGTNVRVVQVSRLFEWHDLDGFEEKNDIPFKAGRWSIGQAKANFGCRYEANANPVYAKCYQLEGSKLDVSQWSKIGIVNAKPFVLPQRLHLAQGVEQRELRPPLLKNYPITIPADGEISAIKG